MLFSRLRSKRKSWRFVLSTLLLSIKQLFLGRNFFLVLMRSCLLTGRVVLQWRRFSILGGKFSDESKILPLSYDFIRMTLFISLKNADDFYKVFWHKIGSSTLRFIHILIIRNPPLKFACDIFERHLHYLPSLSGSHPCIYLSQFEVITGYQFNTFIVRYWCIGGAGTIIKVMAKISMYSTIITFTI